MLPSISPEHLTILSGVGCALISATISTDLRLITKRDSVMIVMLAVISTVNIIDYWKLYNSQYICWLVGFSVGILSDDVYTNLKITLPDATQKIIRSVFNGIARYINKFFGDDK